MFDGPRLFAFAGPSGTGVSEKLLLAVGNLPQRLKRLRKVVTNAQSLPQALKRGQILDDLAARVELVPFPFLAFFEFFRSPLGYHLRGGRSGAYAKHYSIWG